jgi:hypothetical protein
MKTHILTPVTFFFCESRAVYEKISKIMEEPERPQMAIWRRVACLISKATSVQSLARAHVPTHTHR